MDYPSIKTKTADKNHSVYVHHHWHFVCLFAWGLTALSAQIGYIAP